MLSLTCALSAKECYFIRGRFLIPSTSKAVVYLISANTFPVSFRSGASGASCESWKMSTKVL